MIKEIIHVSTKDQLGDIFTKRGVQNHRIINAVSNGRLFFQENGGKSIHYDEDKDIQKVEEI